MARFSQGLLQGLMQPAFGQNLYEVGRAAAAGPAMTRASQRMKEERERTQRDVTGGLFGLEQAAAEGRDYQENVGSLVGLGATPEQIAQAEQRGQVKRQAAVQQQQAEQNETQRQRLEVDAIAKAEEQGRDDIADGLKGASEKTLRDYLLKDISPQGEWKSLGGDSNTLFNSTTGETKTVSVGDASAVPQLKPEEVAKLAKEGLIDMNSFLDFARGGFKDYNTLQPTAQTEDKEAPVIASSLKAADNVLQTIDKALDLTGDYWRLTYDIGKFSPAGQSRPLANKINTLKANLSFDRLQKMRDESKTGGALGQVSNIELRLLGSSVAELDPASEDFKQQLQTVRRHYESFKASLLGQKPPGERYIENEGNLYYVDDDGNFVDLGEM